MDSIYLNLDDKQVHDILIATGERKRRMKDSASHSYNNKLLKRAKIHLDAWKKNGVPEKAFSSLKEANSNVITIFQLHCLPEEAGPPSNGLQVDANVNVILLFKKSKVPNNSFHLNYFQNLGMDIVVDGNPTSCLNEEHSRPFFNEGFLANSASASLGIIKLIKYEY